MEESSNSSCHCSNKIDNLIGLVEKLLEKLTTVEDQVKNKCDTDVVMQLEARVKSVEEGSIRHERDIECKLSALESGAESH